MSAFLRSIAFLRRVYFVYVMDYLFGYKLQNNKMVQPSLS